MTERPVGSTRGAGWQIGVSRTFPVPAEVAWSFLVCGDGVAIWLGAGVDTPLTPGQRYVTADGTAGEIRSLHPLDRVRLTWQPADRAQPATAQVTVRPSPSGCTIRFHTEKLVDAADRERMRTHWLAVAERLREAMA